MLRSKAIDCSVNILDKIKTNSMYVFHNKTIIICLHQSIYLGMYVLCVLCTPSILGHNCFVYDFVLKIPNYINEPLLLTLKLSSYKKPQINKFLFIYILY